MEGATLDFAGRLFRENAFANTLKAVENRGNIRAIFLNSCNLSNDDAAALTELLANCPRLVELDLRGNDIGDQGIELLTQQLMRHETISTINIGRNAFGTRGCLAIANLIAQNASLKVLKLERNRLTDEQVLPIVDALSFNSALEYLHLGDNATSQYGANQLGSRIPASRLAVIHGLGLTHETIPFAERIKSEKHEQPARTPGPR